MRFPAVLVTGARQVGKSTLLEHLFGGEARTFVFDPIQDIGNARADAELFLRLNPAPLILDEIQYAPELLAALKRVVDERRGERGLYFLTGSQQFDVMRGVRESLAGRVGLIDLLPMSAGELGRRTGEPLLERILGVEPGHGVVQVDSDPAVARGGSLLEAIYRGGFPGLLEFETAEIPDWFSSYFQTYIERDVRALRVVQDAREFTRFVQLLAALTAQEINFSQLGREVGITRQTAAAWLDTLASSYQMLLVEAWSGNAVKRATSRPKVHVQDTGLACWLLAVSSPRALNAQPNLGALFETWVVTELLKQAQGIGARPRFWHWRSKGGAEVDLVIERDGVLHLVEVKLSSRPSRRDAQGMGAFQRANPTARVGAKVVVHGGDDVIPLDESTVAIPWWTI